MATGAAGALVAQQVVGKALRDTLFVGTFGVERLPYAMIAAALLSGGLVLALSRAGAGRSARRLSLAALLLSAVLFLVAWGVAGLSPRGAAVLTYLQAGVLSGASVSLFWSLVSEGADPYTARASVPRIMAGATLGGVLGGVATWQASAWLRPSDLLPLGAALNVAALGAVSRLRDEGAPRARPHGDGEGWRAFVRELPYLRALAFVVVAGAVTQAILDYLLASAAVASIGTGPPLLSFFALFQTAVGVLSFLLQVVVSRSALERFGVGPVLAVSPFVLLGGLSAALFAPPVAAAVLLRGADGVLGASVHRSAYEVLFAPLEARKKRASKPLIDVGFDRLGTLLGSGVVALVLAVTTAAPAVLLSAVGALAVWRLWLSRGLQAGYRRSLADNLRQGRLASSAATVLDPGTIASLEAAGGFSRSALLAEVERLRAAQGRSQVSRGEARLSIAAFDVPVGPEPDDEAVPGDPDDAVIAALRDLRSGDAERARRVLRLRRTEPLLAQQVIDLLADDRVARDAADWLTAQEPSPIGLLADALLSDHRPDNARRRVARLLGKSEDPRAAEALLAALPRVPTGVRSGLAHALARSASRRRLPREPILAAVARAAEERPPGDGGAQLEVIFTLLAAAYPREPVQPAQRALDRGGNARGTALEWLDVLLPNDVKRALWPRIIRSGERIPSTLRDADALRTAVRAAQVTPGPLPGTDRDGEHDS